MVSSRAKKAICRQTTHRVRGRPQLGLDRLQWRCSSGCLARPLQLGDCISQRGWKPQVVRSSLTRLLGNDATHRKDDVDLWRPIVNLCSSQDEKDQARRTNRRAVVISSRVGSLEVAVDFLGRGFCLDRGKSDFAGSSGALPDESDFEIAAGQGAKAPLPGAVASRRRCGLVEVAVAARNASRKCCSAPSSVARAVAAASLIAEDHVLNADEVAKRSCAS